MNFLFWFFLVVVLVGQPVSAQSVGGSGVDAEHTPLSAEDLLIPEQRETANMGAAVVSPGASDPVTSTRPFGSNLFNGGFSNDREDGLNPDYKVSTGDRISIRMWGATGFNDDVVVDAQGNIFIPMVGPIAVRGVANRDLNSRVSQSVNTVFTDNVRVYTSLNGSQPVAVFVTGFVNNPGRFSGIPSNSSLYFIDRAGGIDAQRGSYRNIAVLRGGQEIARIDLYDFVLYGEIPKIQFVDGDTIVVGVKGGSVSATGAVKNPALFEIDSVAMTGADLVSSALLESEVTHAGISGTRNGQPFSVYVPISEFASMTLEDGDQVSFQVDAHDNVIVVEVEGSHLGPSRYAIAPNTRLLELLDYIEVDPMLSDSASVSIKRKSIAARQKAALGESLQRLEAKYLTASSQTDRESSIRAAEAQLIGEFVKRARRVKPNGRLVVAGEKSIANIILQAGDTITIPARSESVLLSGEILVSQAMLFQPGMNARDYIEKSGGFTQQAERRRVVLLHATGEVTTGDNPVVRPGDEIIILPKVPVKNLQLASSIVDILYKIAIAASVAVKL